MKNNRLFAVAFTIVMCCVSGTVLTFTHSILRDRIAANERFARIRAVVEALDLELADDAGREAIEEAYNRAVTVVRMGYMDLYEARQNDEIIGYAMEIRCRGKYGLIKGVLTVDAKIERILGLRVYQ